MSDGLDLERELFVPAELVFEVWTRPEHLAAWYPGDGERLSATAQPRGFELRTADGALLERVEEVDAQQASALRWRVRRGGDALELSVEFSGGGGTCTLSLDERGFAGAAERDLRHDVWGRRLERLEAYFSVI